MSYLQNKKGGGGGPSGSSAIISFWVIAGDTGPEHDWAWHQPDLRSLMGANDVTFPGGSYREIGIQLIAPVLRVWPPGPKDRGGSSFRDGMAPFISWGDPQAAYDRVEWKKKVLRSDYWLFGKGGTLQNFVSQYPEKAEPIKGIVPLSCIGCYGSPGQGGTLRVILQTSGKAKYTGYAWAMSSAQAVHVQTPLTEFGGGKVTGWRDTSEGLPGGGSQVGNSIKYTDVSGQECTQHPETFVMDTGVHLGNGWHHILLIYDLSGEAANGYVDAIQKAELEKAHEKVLPFQKPEGALVTVEAFGPPAFPPWPGTYGQYSGPFGDMNLAPLSDDPKVSGRPFEENGLGSGPANDGNIDSQCAAWLWVDGKPIGQAGMHHAGALGNVRYGFETLAGGRIVPVNALVALSGDPRLMMTTSQTAWEREYRTELGKFTGPAAKIAVTDEMRRFSYPLPKYELNSASLASGAFAIPAGTAWDPGGSSSSRNIACTMAEMYIWNGKWCPPEKIYDLLVKNGKPRNPRHAEEALGAASLKLHWATKWINAGRSAKEIAEESEAEKASKFSPYGEIKRSYPGP
jgi:hypothetical protein